MKRRLSALLAACLLLCLCACGASPIRPVPPALPDSFQCSVHMLIDRQAVDFTWTMSHGASVLRILSPSQLQGMTVRLSADLAQIGSGDVSAPLQDTSCFVRLHQAYLLLLQSPIEPTQTEQGWLYDASQSGFTVLQDMESGLPLRISVPAEHLTAAFSGVSDTESVTAA